MRLEHLCDMELSYREEPAYGGKLVLVRPYEGEEGTAYGEGDGTVTGERLHGTVRWVNYLRRRNDGVMLPDVRGVITTEDHALVLFRLHGRTSFREGAGTQLLGALFEAEDDRYRWLNRELCVLEGLIDPHTFGMRAKVHLCVPEPSADEP